MPTLSQILSDIDIRFPNPFPTEQKIYWANECLRKVFKYMNDYEIYSFNTVENQAIYTLPNDCSIDLIVNIEVSIDSTNTLFNSYAIAPLLGETQGNNYYDAFSGLDINNVPIKMFGLSPIPDGVYDGKIFYKKRPFTLTSNDLTVTPAINEDYHSIITYYVCMCMAVAGNNPDTAMYNNFTQLFNDDWFRMSKDLLEKKIKAPLKNRSNKWW